MEAPKPVLMETPQNEKELKNIKFTSEFKTKINNDNYLIQIGILEDYLVIKVTINGIIKNDYISFFTYEQLKVISKSMRFFDDIKDFISFLENKIKKKEIFLKKEKENIYIEVKVISPSEKEDIISLVIKPKIISDKEIINQLLEKVSNLEKQVDLLNKEVTKNKADIDYLMKKENKRVIGNLFG